MHGPVGLANDETRGRTARIPPPVLAGIEKLRFVKRDKTISMRVNQVLIYPVMLVPSCLRPGARSNNFIINEGYQMKLKLVALALIAGFSMIAQAQEAAKPAAPARAEVKAEAKAANKAGETKPTDAEKPAAKAKSTKARADVKAEAKEANKAGEAKPSDAEKPAAKAKSTKARADVKAEA